MADHCRKQIRDTIAAYLAANLATVLSVEVGHVHPLANDAATLPALLIFTNEESAEDLTKATATSKDRKIARALTVTMQAHATGQSVVDTLDGIAAEVEAALLAAVPAWVKEVEFKSTTVELSGEPVEPVGMMTLEYAVVYHTNMATPDTPK